MLKENTNEKYNLLVPFICTLKLKLPRDWLDELGIQKTLVAFDEETRVELYNPDRLDKEDINRGKGELLYLDDNNILTLPKWARGMFVPIGNARLSREAGGIFITSVWEDPAEEAPGELLALHDFTLRNLVTMESVSTYLKDFLYREQEDALQSRNLLQAIVWALDYHNEILQDCFFKLTDAYIEKNKHLS